MTPILTALLIQAALNGLFLIAGYAIGKRAESRRRDAQERSFLLADHLLDQRARRAEGAGDNVFTGPWGGRAA